MRRIGIVALIVVALSLVLAPVGAVLYLSAPPLVKIPDTGGHHVSHAP